MQGLADSFQFLAPNRGHATEPMDPSSIIYVPIQYFHTVYIVTHRIHCRIVFVDVSTYTNSQKKKKLVPLHDGQQAQS